MKKPILFVGTATADIIALVDHLPKSDERIAALNLIKCGGGPAANAAVSAQTLGAPCSIITAVGDDSTGKEIIQELSDYKIDVSGIQTIENGISSTSCIQVERSSGSRSITYYGGSLSSYELNNFPSILIENCSIIHADGNNPELTLQAFKLGKEKGKTTSLDGGNISDENLQKLLPYVDVYITDSKSIPQWAFFDDLKSTCKILTERGPKLVAVTLGKKGCLMFDTKQYYQSSGIEITVVDTTGAGDNFHGAFVYGLWRDLSYEECLELANTFAALSCQGLGGRRCLPTYEYIAENFLNKITHN
ncbi:carbohydrate kinase family protein [Domibacillus robiginosus]|uniref:carbohydrate kinase family protein n=1 Tax=Domibacillus robiginosus TaxID=1071054 RepID=UPI00067AEE86|nr:PfkB family carbohydrate kinase [Domibacillus robiginosus]